jgi:putative transposase
MNRGVRRMCLFEDRHDYFTLVKCALEALEIVPVDLFAFCLMPNHFHMIVRPHEDPDLTHFMGLMTMRHSKRWHHRRRSVGCGAVYQGRFRAFPIESERYFYTACRYVEANPLRAQLVPRAEDWRWSSLHQRVKNCDILPLTQWPILRPEAWTETVNAVQKDSDLRQLRHSARFSAPFGDTEWASRVAAVLGTASSLHRPGPQKAGS